MILGHQRGRVSGTALETTQNEEHHKLLKDSRFQNTEDKTAHPPKKREDMRASLAAKDKCFVSYFP